MLTAEVVIVGGGVVGASVAYHLAARGVRGVMVLERGAGPGSGSTGRATGGFRAQFGTEVNVRLSLLSREKLLSFEEETGVDSGYLQAGYLFLAHDEAQFEALLDAQDVQMACGLYEPHRVFAPEIARLNPAYNLEGVVGGVYCDTDGFIRPLEILRGYTEAASRMGVVFRHGVALEGAKGGGGGRAWTLRTSAGDVSAGVVVNAAGAWAGEVGRKFGAEVPVTPLRRQVAVTEPTDLLPHDMPMTINVGDGFHLRERDGRVLLLWPDDPRPGRDPFDTTFDEDWLGTVLAKAHANVPCLKGVGIDRAACWAGLYEMSPDRHAILGRAPGFQNLYLANGSSGHGVMHAPALGQLLAEIILDGAAQTLDTHALRPSRFLEGDPNAGPSLL